MEISTEESNEQKKELQPEGSETLVKQEMLEQYIEKLRLDQNLPFGIIGGTLAAIIGAILWAVITVVTEYQIGYMAVAIGFIVGFSIRFAGKGIDKIFGIMGAVLSIIGCILGNFLSIVGFVANDEGLGYFETLLLIDYSLIPEIMMSSFSPMDLLFYGIAVYEGYKFSFRQITEQELLDNSRI